MRRYLIAVALLLLLGCGDDILGPTHVTCDDFLLQFGVAPGDTIETSEGLRYVDLQAGAGEAAVNGLTADVNYAGYLVDGTPFDTSCPPTRAVLRLTIGGGGVIPGFMLGVTGMRPGGVRRIIIPPELGYGATPVGPIPANSTLVFDLQLVGFVGR
jgi:FKBP-type peptidyl-prolyl cis-trans isomerase FkpA